MTTLMDIVKKKIKRPGKISAACLMLFILTITPLTAYASNINAGVLSNAREKRQPEKTDSKKEDEIHLPPVAKPESAPLPDQNEPVYEPVSHTQDNFFYRKTLKGIYSSTYLYFYVEDYWDTKYVYAKIQYDVSQLIESTASSVTFAINDVPIQSYKLEYKDGNSQILYVKIPMDQVRSGYNSFSISAYARLFDQQGCVDDYSDANWLGIADTSYIRCGYESRDPEHRISFYPYPFMSTYNPTGKGLYIAVSDEAASGEVASAMSLMADLSKQTGKRNEIELCRISDLKSNNPSATILISDYNNLPAEYKNKMTKAPDTSGNVIVNFIDDSNLKPLLLITSNDGSSLKEAVDMLMDESRRKQENGNLAVVEKGSGEQAVNGAKQSDLTAWNYTLEDIMGSGLSFVGPFHQEKYVYLPVSRDFVLAQGGKVVLKFRYSENLDFKRSLITVFWGDVPCASKRLSQEKASGDELNFEMPADVIGTSAASLKIAFDLEIPDLICTPRQSDMPWAYVSRESAIFLPPSADMRLSFDSGVSPFSRNGKFNDVLLILGDNPTSVELNLLGQTLAMYGREAKPYGTILVKRAGEFNKDDGDYNIITAGTLSGNTFLAQINNNLAFQFSQDGNSFESNDQLILSRDYAGKIGIMQLLKSPYSLNRTLLVLAGSSQDTLKNLEDYLRDSSKREELKKDCVVIDANQNITTLKFIKAEEVKEGPTLTEKLVRNKKSLVFTVIATSAMFLMLFAVIIILLRIRVYRKKNEE